MKELANFVKTMLISEAVTKVLQLWSCGALGNIAEGFILGYKQT